jgi:ferredoxin
LSARLVVHLKGARHEVPHGAGESILASARKAGLTPPFACEESYCGCCMAKLVRGTVSMRQHSALDADDLAEGWILACQAVPSSDECEIRWE